MTALSDLKTQQADLLQRLRQAETIVASETVDVGRLVAAQNERAALAILLQRVGERIAAAEAAERQAQLEAAQAKRRLAIDKATAQAVKDFRALWASLAELGAVYDVTLAPGAANYLANLRASLAATAEGLRMTGVDIPR